MKATNIVKRTLTVTMTGHEAETIHWLAKEIQDLANSGEFKLSQSQAVVLNDLKVATKSDSSGMTSGEHRNEKGE